MSTFPNWNRIRQHYRAAPASIFTVSDEWMMDPYAWDSQAGIALTPIEQALWHDIREADLVLYPQFPVGRFFVDFGNPAAKVAIECDGVQWHQDWGADKERQEAIESLGWRVYRIIGRDCLQDGKNLYTADGVEVWQPSPGRTLIDHIGQHHNIKRRMTRGRAKHACAGVLQWLDKQLEGRSDA